MTKPRAVFLDALSLGPVDLAPLERHAELICWPSTPPQLRLICAASTGTDQIDGQACSELGIAVRNAGRYSTASVVQVTWALILELVCDLRNRRRQVLEGDWQRSPVFSLVEPEFDELAGRTLTVLGAGTIGRGVAAVASAFGMDVRLITSRSGAGELEAALRQADVLSLHAPLTPATRGLINAERLSWLKPSAVLVNLGRGGLIELPALVKALQRGALAGAALDVLDKEPPGAELEALKEVPNLILTPHIGWASRQARQRLVAALAAELQSHIEE